MMNKMHKMSKLDYPRCDTKTTFKETITFNYYQIIGLLDYWNLIRKNSPVCCVGALKTTEENISPDGILHKQSIYTTKNYI